MNIKSIFFDNDGTLYELKPEFKEDIIQSMISYLSKKLDVSEREATSLRERLIRKYGVESTEFAFGREYNMPYDEFVKSTYLSIDTRNSGIRYNKKLREMLRKIKLPKSQ